MPRKKLQSKKIKRPKVSVHEVRTWQITRALLMFFIIGVVLSTSATVFAKSYFQVAKLFDEVELFVNVVSPKTREVVGKNMKLTIWAQDASGINRVEFFQYRSLEPLLLQTLRGAGPVYYANFDTTQFMDHNYQVFYAKAYANDGGVVTSPYIHVQIDRCPDGIYCTKVFQGRTDQNKLEQKLTGLDTSAVYSLTYVVKKATASLVTFEVVNDADQSVIQTCGDTLQAFESVLSTLCTFTPGEASNGNVTVRIFAGDASAAYTESQYVYVDDIRLVKEGTQQNLIQNPSFETVDANWSFLGAQVVSSTPITNVKPFDPSVIYSVSSNLEKDPEQNVGFWFFKGWPRAHYSWWTMLGQYERPPLGYDPAGSYAYNQAGTDRFGWYSPLTMLLSRESNNPAEFSYNDIKVSVLTDKGALTMCIPDLTWDNQLLNGTTGMRSLIADEFGNTYYAGKYNDPDLLTQDNIAKRCACSDGTAVGACNATKNAVCQTDGSLTAADCRTCGCSGVRSSCVEGTDGTYACKETLPIFEVAPE